MSVLPSATPRFCIINKPRCSPAGSLAPSGSPYPLLPLMVQFGAHLVASFGSVQGASNTLPEILAGRFPGAPAKLVASHATPKVYAPVPLLVAKFVAVVWALVLQPELEATLID